MKLHDWLLERAKNARGLATGLDGSRVTERKPNGEPSNYARGVKGGANGLS